MKKLLFLLPIILLFYGTTDAQRLTAPGVRSYTTGIDSLEVTAWIKADSVKARAMKIDSTITVSYIVDTRVNADSIYARSAKLSRIYADTVFSSFGKAYLTTKVLRMDSTITATGDSGKVTGLSLNVKAGRKYIVYGRMFIETTAAQGCKIGLRGSAVFDTLRVQADIVDNANIANTVSNTLTYLGQSVGKNATGMVWCYIALNGTISCTTAGTIYPVFGQNVPGDTSHCYMTAGSYMKLEEF